MIGWRSELIRANGRPAPKGTTKRFSPSSNLISIMQYQIRGARWYFPPSVVSPGNIRVTEAEQERRRKRENTLSEWETQDFSESYHTRLHVLGNCWKVSYQRRKGGEAGNRKEGIDRWNGKERWIRRKEWHTNCGDLFVFVFVIPSLSFGLKFYGNFYIIEYNSARLKDCSVSYKIIFHAFLTLHLI